MKTLINLFYFFTAVVILFIACDSTINEVENIIFPDKNVSFDEHVYPVLYTKCATANGCHSSTSRAGGYSLESYLEITEPGLVDKYSPETSLLVWILKGSQPHITLIPRPLTTNQVDGIVTWIKEGAREYPDEN